MIRSHRLLWGGMLTLALSVCLGQQPAQAWNTMECYTAPGYRPFYDNDAVWPLYAFGNIPPGNWARMEMDSAVGSWNSIYGANDILSIASESYQYCSANDNAGHGVIGWDDGTCMGAFDNNWGANTLGVTLTWYDSEYCHIVRQAVYLNANQNWTAEQIRSVATHELGHYLIYGHNWYNVSVMGYTYSTTPPMTFLTADDHSFLRTLYPSGNQAEANVHIHPYVLVSAVGIPIVEDQLSYTTSPPPTCSGGCQNVRPGDTISVILTYGNTGNTDTSGPVEFSATLGGVEIGHWSVSSGLPAHAWSTYEFTATVSSSVPTGTNAFELWIDPDYTYASGYGPSAGRYVSYPGFVTPCDPACTDNECSADGCGGSCGTCSGAGVCEVTGQYTHQGLTRYTSRCVCEPQCLGRQCGDDGCGGTCGSCGFGTTHCVNGQCRECGSDWDCASGEMCTPLGCQPIDQSSGAPKAGCGCATPVEHSGTLLVAAVLLFLLLRRRFRQYRS